MSSQSYSTFQSSSYASTSDGAGNTYTETTSSNPSGTTVHCTSKKAGQPAVVETTHLPARGGNAQIEGMGSNRRVEDVTDTVTDADRAYHEAMEDEYAKREGGA